MQLVMEQAELLFGLLGMPDIGRESRDYADNAKAAEPPCQSAMKTYQAQRAAGQETDRCAAQVCLPAHVGKQAKRHDENRGVAQRTKKGAQEFGRQVASVEKRP